MLIVLTGKMAYPPFPTVLLKEIFRALASSRTSDFGFDEMSLFGRWSFGQFILFKVLIYLLPFFHKMNANFKFKSRNVPVRCTYLIYLWYYSWSDRLIWNLMKPFVFKIASRSLIVLSDHECQLPEAEDGKVVKLTLYGQLTTATEV